NPIPMAGFPHHQLDSYLGKIIRKGFRAAVCEQVEDPKEAKGLVKREVTRVVTPGTVTDDGLLDPRASNYLAAVIGDRDKRGVERVGLAWAELSTGRFFALSAPRRELADHLARIAPSECLVSEDESWSDDELGVEFTTGRPSWAFGSDSSDKTLLKHFAVKSLEGFGFHDDDRPAIRAAGAVLDYLQETQKASLAHIERLTPYRLGQTLEIDQATRRSLEISRTLRDGGREGSLLSMIDRTATSMGSRTLADWLSNPLTDIEAIDARLDAVAELRAAARLRENLRDRLKGVYDLERLVARVTTGRASPRDLRYIGRSLAGLPSFKESLAARDSRLLTALDDQIDTCPQLADLLDTALGDDCPLHARDGGFIRGGFHEELDRLRELAAGGKQWIADYQALEAERIGVPKLKVGFNKVFGYYIELTNAQRDNVPAEYIRKQTLKNAERFITPELKEYEEQVVSADERANQLEYDVFLELRAAVQASARALQRSALALAQLDVLLSLAELAAARNYCRPQLVNEPTLEIVDGRHPVLDILEPEGTFVPNDCHAQAGDSMVLLITGPNMAGKSTYIRQVALITIMAQMGGFTPAKSAVIGVADRVFARVGASDELARGQSTFMVEMTETARILNTATERSLVILDEIGRGTSTYDGVSLAWAIVEHIHDEVGCRTLFATHYHELTDLAHSLAAVTNLNVSVKEWEDNVVFLHKIVGGAADKSYGIHVARLAGVPRSVNERAKQILAQLEAEHLDEENRPKIGATGKQRPRSDIQLTLFAPYDHPVVERLKSIDLNQLTPLDAIQVLKELQDEVREDVVAKPR
ncbi:MAG: DNA mismatch repair protein MutS, partial [Pirellulaceae bacterium]|nr:DNA mismatch repair protein MutS [Pirellulaceae bacterium]